MIPKMKSNPDTDDVDDYRKAWQDIMKKDWLFPDHSGIKDKRGSLIQPPSGPEDYFEHFSRKHRLQSFRSNLPYKLSFLEDNKERIVLSGQLATEGGVVPYSILQWSETEHAVVDWVWHESGEIIFPASFLCTHINQYRERIKDVAPHEFFPRNDNKSLGFGSR